MPDRTDAKPTEAELDLLRILDGLPYAPTKTKLAELAGCCRRTLHDRIERLIELGMIDDCWPGVRGVQITDAGRVAAGRQEAA